MFVLGLYTVHCRLKAVRSGFSPDFRIRGMFFLDLRLSLSLFSECESGGQTQKHGMLPQVEE